jgi:hypothetical protein
MKMNLMGSLMNPASQAVSGAQQLIGFCMTQIGERTPILRRHGAADAGDWTRENVWLMAPPSFGQGSLRGIDTKLLVGILLRFSFPALSSHRVHGASPRLPTYAVAGPPSVNQLTER